jgi:LacI family transcriptional regulator
MPDSFSLIVKQNLMSKLTIHDIAKHAGVSTGTVSRALNGRFGVSAATRDRVLRVVNELGYVPDPGARQLAKGARTVIGITRFSETSLRNAYYTMLLDLIQEALVGAGYAVRILDTKDVARPGVAGMIVPGVYLADPRFEELRAHQRPFVVIGEMPPEYTWVEVDNRNGMRQAIEHLLGLGHTRIVHMTGSPIGQTAQLRLETYQNVMRDANLETSDNMILDGRFTQLGAYRAMQRALAQKLEFTAVACASDEMAFGVLAALEDAGLNVPNDISVTGFDDLPLDDNLEHLPLTTIHQPMRLIGHTAAQLMLELLEGAAPRGVLLPTHLVTRASTAMVRQTQTA